MLSQKSQKVVEAVGLTKHYGDGVVAVQSIHLDPAAAKADLTVALSRAPARYKIYVHSASFTQQDAAALFAVIWQTAGKTASSGREFAARN